LARAGFRREPFAGGADAFEQHRRRAWAQVLGRHQALTIEVNIPKLLICQVRGKCNRLPSASESAIVKCWAAAEGLRVEDDLLV
jgi:hypothetical protein